MQNTYKQSSKLRYKMNLFNNKLNGWQRLFVLLFLTSTLAGYGLINVTEVTNDSFNLFNYLPELAERPCEKKNSYECDPVVSVFSTENNKKFLLENGSYYFLDNRYEHEQVQKAYDTALSEAKKKRAEKLVEAYKDTTFSLLAIFITLYIFGWMIGWVKNGFTKNND